jgi:hypothetical protein
MGRVGLLLMNWPVEIHRIPPMRRVYKKQVPFEDAQEGHGSFLGESMVGRSDIRRSFLPAACPLILWGDVFRHE